jgi:Zn-dependent M28 family amino/carboxypeptidase
VGFTEEEQGLVGSSYYVQSLSSEQVAKLRAMINLDSLGLGPTKVWLNHSDMNLSRHMERLAFMMRFPFAVVNGDRVGDDDSTPFKKRGVPTLMLHSITQDTLSILHTARDRMDKIALGDYYASYNQIAAYLAYIDAILD